MGTLKIAHLNVRSLINSFNNFATLITGSNYKVFAVTETWLTPDVDSELVNIPGYNFYRCDRLTRGGGVGVYVSNQLNCQLIELDIPNNDRIEYIWLKLKINCKSYAIGTFYRPPKNNLLEGIQCIDQALSLIIPTVDEVICVGDFNVNLFNLENILSRCFDAYGFHQIINEPTRIANNSSTLLDPIFLSNKESVNSCTTLNVDHISDHKLVFCDISVKIPSFKQKLIKIRNFKNIDQNRLLQDLYNLPLHNILRCTNIDTKVSLLTTYLTTLYDVHAPLREVRLSKPKAPWLTDNIKLMMKTRDRALQKYKRTKNTQDYTYYKELRNLTLTAIRNEKRAYINSVCNRGNIKNTWSTLKSLNVKKGSNKEVPRNLANASEINSFFHSVFQITNSSDTDNLIEYYETNQFSDKIFNFSLVTVEEVGKIQDSLTSNASGYDNISLMMLKYCCPHILPFLTHIINCCLECGYFPSLWKNAVIIPLPKKNNIISLADIRPISILPVISKILEKVVYYQLFAYADTNNIIDHYQSGFRSSHSTATALTRICDDIIAGIDNKKLTAVALLDFSKAFDTINHSVLCAKLGYYGLSDIVVSFFKSYLTNRQQMVLFNDEYSSLLPVISGVPQGSVLGPLLFSIYTTEILRCTEHCSVQAYADDQQVYFTFSPSDINYAQAVINSDLENIRKVSLSHNLKLNPNKCELIIFGSRKQAEFATAHLNIAVGTTTLPIVSCSKNLGLYLDNQLKFTEHVSSLLRKAYGSLKLLYASRFILPANLKKMLSESLVLSYFNYCDVVYGHFLNCIDKNRIQQVQNWCSRFIFNLRKYDHISHTYKELKWLNMENRRKLNFLVFVHRIVTSSLPSYLYSRLTHRSNIHSRNVRNKHMYHIPQHVTAIFKKSFSYCSVDSYNSIPIHFRSLATPAFKQKVKKKMLNEQ